MRVWLLFLISSLAAADCRFEAECDLLEAGMQWSHCQALNAQPILPKASSDTLLQGDALLSSIKEGRMELRGNAFVQQGQRRIYAQELFYDERQQRIDAPKSLWLELPELRLRGQQGWYDLNEHRGAIKAAEYRLFYPKARGQAETIAILDEQRSRYQKIEYTTCPPGNEGFLLQAEQALFDQQEGVALFEKAKLRFLGLPILYAPKLKIRLDDQRQSGFLTPTLGYSSINGLDYIQPYYFNLAPNYDATLMPRIMSERGFLLGGELRYLQPDYFGQISAEILPDDRLYQEGNRTRGSLHLSHTHYLSYGITGFLDLNWASDPEYKQDLGRSFVVSSSRFLRNRGALEWHDPHWDIWAEAVHYQTLDDSIAKADRPYSLLPRLNADGFYHQAWLGLDYQLHAEWVSFYRDNEIYGHRLDLYPIISRRWQSTWAYIEPQAQLRYTRYSIGEVLQPENDQIDRSTYSLSLDSGLFFERPLQWRGKKWRQTLEPRAFYTYTPYENQDHIPLFDTGLMDFNFYNLFYANRFNGPDRVGDANQLSLGLTSRLLDEWGQERIHFNLGQIIYFADRRVQLEAGEPIEDSRSSWIASLGGQWDDHWHFLTAVQYDPHHEVKKLRQGLAQVSYQNEEIYFRAQWRLREELIEQTDLAAIVPLPKGIKLIGRWLYSSQDHQTLEALAGLEYNNCCWRMRAVVRHYLNGNRMEYDNTFYLQLELKGLGSLGNNIDSLLDKTVYDR